MPDELAEAMWGPRRAIAEAKREAERFAAEHPMTPVQSRQVAMDQAKIAASDARSHLDALPPWMIDPALHSDEREELGEY